MSKIQTYDDLLAEKVELERILRVQRGIISQDILELKEELKPARQLISFLGKITLKDRSNSLVNLGVDVLGDLLIKNFVLAKSGWITRLVLPYFIKNFSSNVIGKNGSAILHKLTDRFRKN